MIKLKTLIKEIDGLAKWVTPDKTPNQVITILHLIIAEIIKAGLKVDDFIRLSERKLKDGKVSWWTIDNKKNDKKGLLYKSDEWCWYSMNSNIPGPLNAMVLNAIIKGWVK